MRIVLSTLTMILTATAALAAPEAGDGAVHGKLVPLIAPLDAEPAVPKTPPKVLKGGTSVTAPGTDGTLSGQADDTSGGTLTGQAASDEPNAAMKAALSSYGEDAGNRALEIKWDAWRNRFLRAAEEQVQKETEARPDPARARFGGIYPKGTEATFQCEINDEKRITALKIVKSSGFREFDRNVFIGIQALDGRGLLQFPAKSQRKLVQQAAVMYAAESNPGFTPFNFGDIERLIEQSTPKQPAP